jgi:hypothetical protein
MGGPGGVNRCNVHNRNEYSQTFVLEELNVFHKGSEINISSCSRVRI